ncbi:Tat pathway signal sequence domain protein [Actinoplanes sp. NPDC020271]|uniref:Tat pathway signal sequence domain protein n=1 Tax=Actinoplanes sp. NPDC020271 TaxID=3363896 RepID=UPI00379E828F
MHVKNRIAAAVVTGAAASLLLTAPALADDTAVLTTGTLAGPAVAAGDTISASIVSGAKAVFATAAGGSNGMKCAASSFSAAVNDNPVAPGAAALGSTLAVSSCTISGVPGVTGVNSVTINNQPYATTVASDGTVTVTGTDAAPISATLNLKTLLGSVTCVFVANGNAISAVADNTDNSITFTDQQFNKTTGPSACVANGFFTAKYTPVVTSAGAPVFVN